MSQPVESVAVVGAGAMGAMYAAHLADAGIDDNTRYIGLPDIG